MTPVKFFMSRPPSMQQRSARIAILAAQVSDVDLDVEIGPHEVLQELLMDISLAPPTLTMPARVDVVASMIDDPRFASHPDSGIGRADQLTQRNVLQHDPPGVGIEPGAAPPTRRRGLERNGIERDRAGVG